MAVLNNERWYTEIHPGTGTAFSFEIRQQLHHEVTPYQEIAIYETERFGHLMVIDDCMMVTSRENFLYHEMMTHPALFSHAAPRDVVIIGGGDCGTLREVLRHKGVQTAIQIEIDERVTRLAEEYFPELCEANSDPRGELLFEDGIAWMDAVAPESLDIIIVDSTDPVGPAEGLFTKAFYHNCWKALRPGGILVAQSESPLLHVDLIASMRNAMHAAGFDNTHTLSFPQPCYPSGWWSASMAGKGVDVRQFREQDAADKAFKTQYYNAAMHRASLAVPEFMMSALDQQGSVKN